MGSTLPFLAPLGNRLPLAMSLLLPTLAGETALGFGQLHHRRWVRSCLAHGGKLGRRRRGGHVAHRGSHPVRPCLERTLPLPAHAHRTRIEGHQTTSQLMPSTSPPATVTGAPPVLA